MRVLPMLRLHADEKLRGIAEMRLLFTRVRGRLRLARGWCPACASESPEGCPVCRGHEGPFPAEPDRLRRWAARFAAGLASHASGPSARGPESGERRSE